MILKYLRIKGIEDYKESKPGEAMRLLSGLISGIRSIVARVEYQQKYKPLLLKEKALREIIETISRDIK